MDANLEEKKDIHKQIVSEVRFSFFDLSPDGLHSSSLGGGDSSWHLKRSEGSSHCLYHQFIALIFL